MKGATKCAQKLKALFNRLRKKSGKVAPPPPGDGITQLILGVLSRDMPETKAREALDRLLAMVVDFNELRVIPPFELGAALGDIPDVRTKSEDISRALNRIFAAEHAVSLDRVQQLPRKEMTTYLEQVDGLEAYTRARIRLLAFGAPTVPLDTAMWAQARKDQIVDPDCSLDEAHAFVERTVAAADALEFFALYRKHAWSESGAAVRRGSVERVSSVPPDRTIRNMLRQVASGDLNTIPPDAAGGSAAAPGAKSADKPKAAAGKRVAKPKREAKSTAGRPKRKSTSKKSSRVAGKSR